VSRVAPIGICSARRVLSLKLGMTVVSFVSNFARARADIPLCLLVCLSCRDMFEAKSVEGCSYRDMFCVKSVEPS
jgi:hypothetical protein